MAKQLEQNSSGDKIDMVNNPSSLETSTGTGVAGDMVKVKLETMAIIKSIPWSKSCNDFPVLVRVTAPPPDDETSRAGVDIVAVLDTSEGIAVENRLENVKQAVKLLIQQLGTHDRLSLVSFNNKKAQRLMELSEMTDENRDKARAEVDKLKARGGNDVGVAMQEAALILGQRKEKEKSSRDGRVLVLSDDKTTVPAEIDDPRVMRYYIADSTAADGNQDDLDDEDKIKDAMKQSIIRGGAPVIATGLQINLQTHEGVAISSMESGSHCASFSPQVRSSMIQIQELRTGEQKNFVVYLTVPEGKEHLINFYGAYNSPNLSGEENSSVQLDHSEIAISRPKESTPSDEETVVYPEEGAEFIWLRLADGLSTTVEHRADDRLHKLWEVLNSEKKVKPENIPVHEKAKIMWEKCVNWVVCKPYLYVLPHVSSVKKIIMERMTHKLVHTNPPLEQQENTRKKTEIGQGKGKLINNCSSYTTCVIAAVLLVAFLCLMKSLPLTRRYPDVVPHQMDISQHPGLPKIEKSLEATMLQTMEEDVGISSILHGASIESMSDAINRYIYLGLVHTLGGGCTSNSVEAEIVSLLEQKVTTIEVEKDLRVKMEALAKEEEKVSTSNCKENKEALERVNARIAELEKQLQDKKAFTDSLLLEAANADTHLKTCNRRADMLEANVRKMEVVTEFTS